MKDAEGRTNYGQGLVNAERLGRCPPILAEAPFTIIS